MTQIKKVAVIGAGTMGGGIAAHCINAGLQVVLLDTVPSSLTPDEEKRGLTLESKEVRNRFVQAGLERIKNARPAALFDPQSVSRIVIGNVEDDLATASSTTRTYSSSCSTSALSGRAPNKCPRKEDTP
jgi:3-hydroxyacyl-CoA dehydrogenase